MTARRSFVWLAALVAVAVMFAGCSSEPTADDGTDQPDPGPPPRTDIERAAQRLRSITREQIESLTIGMAWGDVQMHLGQPDFLTTNVGPYLRAKEGGIYWLEFEGGGIWLTRAIYFDRGLTKGEIILPVADRGKSVRVESVGGLKKPPR